jgi:hypothetical protein
MAEEIQSSINYKRYFSLPIGVPPESLDKSKTLDYLKDLQIDIDIYHNTYNKYTAGKPSKSQLLLIDAEGSNDKMILPSFSKPENLAFNYIEIKKSTAKSIINGTWKTLKIQRTATPEDIADLVKRTIFFDNDSSKISNLPIPQCGRDSMRLFWPNIDDSNLSGLMDTPLPGVLPLTGLFSPSPDYLLATSMCERDGELNRLNIRSPILGSVRFEFYHHFSKSDRTINILNRSNTGRLIIKGKFPRKERLKSSTHLFDETEFIIDHVDAESVIYHFYRILVFYFSNLENFVNAFYKKHDSNKNLSLTVSKFRVFKLSLGHMFIFWILFNKFIDRAQGDEGAYNLIPHTIRQKINKKQKLDKIKAILLKAGTDWLIEMSNYIIRDDQILTKFLTFVESRYVPLLIGKGWYELGIEFPVSDQKEPKKSNKNIHAFLESIHDPKNKWLVCYSGCPLGYPAPLYSSDSELNSTQFPSTGITTYELEAIYLAGKTTTLYSDIDIQTNTDIKLPPDLTPFSSKVAGKSCTFYTREIMDTRIYTTIDWFEELLKGIKIVRKETGRLSIDKFFNQNNSTGQPITQLLNIENFLRAKAFRAQMDILDNTKIGNINLGKTNLNWWKENILWKRITDQIAAPIVSGRWPDAQDPAPSAPYKKDTTIFPARSGVVPFDNGRSRVSGFDFFDLESIFLARSKVINVLTGKYDMPVPVLLALADREGIRVFAWLNRKTTNKLRWITNSGPLFDLTNRSRNERHSLGRIHWLWWPYGLDWYTRIGGENALQIGTQNYHFKQKIQQLKNENILVADKGIEEVQKYFDERVNSSWPSPTGPSAIPQIWKLTRRSHWAFISLMAAKFQIAQKHIREKNIYSYSDDSWIEDPPPINKDSTSNTNRKDYITYYSLIYLAYNSHKRPNTWNSIIDEVERDTTRGNMSLRDFLVFKYCPKPPNNDPKYFDRSHPDYDPDNTHLYWLDNLAHMRRFAIGLDAYLHLDYLESINPDEFSDIEPNTESPEDRNWGL